ncbi:MAG: adenine phosphoribosyltransferase [Nitrospinaceae bacterium]|nr:adenine phosphoribosyltransferase [Nitrospina sp.]MBT5375266.1 adenine phosphoribosyltransferase [Nitrospinaceae bacterium]MBT5867746.1 adenine phosphoribosyltransferase [Nitrospinaceae bacterium]
MESLKNIIRDIPDFPKEGIVFKDITPLLGDPVAFQKAINILKDRYAGKTVDAVVGVEARGFIFASALAYALGTGVVMVRKPGKLPYKTFQETYSLEYGTDTVEIHQDALVSGQNIIVIDDVLATGGTLSATLDLIQKNFTDINIIEAAFLIELDFLKGREKLNEMPVYSMIHY